MSTIERIKSDLVRAMKEKDALRLQVLRSLKTRLTEKEISVRDGGRRDLTEDEAVEVLMKAAKQRKESIEQFRQGGREDLAIAEEQELAIIGEYLPTMMTREEIEAAVAAVIAEIGAVGIGDMGRVMGALMGRFKGKADAGEMSAAVKRQLA
jgi:uncharacterized protein YqeY